MFWTDDPVADAEAWYAAQEQRQTLWETTCETRVICGDPIDPNFDSECINLWGHYMHTQCMSKLLGKAEAEVRYDSDFAIFDLITEALEESYTDTTPIPEED